MKLDLKKLAEKIDSLSCEFNVLNDTALSELNEQGFVRKATATAIKATGSALKNFKFIHSLQMSMQSGEPTGEETEIINALSLLKKYESTASKIQVTQGDNNEQV